MKLIVGLGNPGKEYQKSRHNIGFMVLDELAKSLESTSFKKEEKFKAEISSGVFKGTKYLLAKPLTFMNLSGESVIKISQFYKISPEDIVIIYDDLDLPLGQIRIRTSGSAGTHNGMKSVVQSLATQDIPRLRIGIESRGELAPKQQETVSFVLEDFLKSEQSLVQQSLQKSEEAVRSILEEGFSKAMDRYNQSGK